jgi:hypothetical protein
MAMLNEMTKETSAIARCHCCKTDIDAATWAAMPLVGHMDLDEDGDGRVELRNHPCGSTLGAELPAIARAA